MFDDTSNGPLDDPFEIDYSPQPVEDNDDEGDTLSEVE